MASRSATSEVLLTGLRDWRDPSLLAPTFGTVRDQTLALVAPLSAEDCVIQSMPDVSPTRWHLAHTTWFFETFLLLPYLPGWTPVDPAFAVLFNSYYNGIGEQFPRNRRGLQSRPGLPEIRDYRTQVEDGVAALLAGQERYDEWAPLLLLGLHHEQQHQELILTDIKHVLAQNPLWPVYQQSDVPLDSAPLPHAGWLTGRAGLVDIGHAGASFAFDNESPRHKVWLEDYQLASNLITNGEWLQFMQSGGYTNPQLWTSLGWDWVRQEGWTAPLYWLHQEDTWWQFTLQGLLPLHLQEPVCHVSWFEADAFARWAGARLPLEAEWEQCALAQAAAFRLPGPVWEWTASPYTPYPGYQPAAGAVGEYNGKFMCNQYVLRGGSSATPPGHIRPTYRNFFPPEARWQFTGLRLAR